MLYNSTCSAYQYAMHDYTKLCRYCANAVVVATAAATAAAVAKKRWEKNFRDLSLVATTWLWQLINLGALWP
jgi:hypothetical protein